MRGLNASSRKSRSRDLAGDPFAETGDGIGGALGQFAYGHYATQQFVQGIEVSFQFRGKLLETVSAQQIGGRVVVARTRVPGEFESSLAIAGAGSGGHSQKLVGNFGQS